MGWLARLAAHRPRLTLLVAGLLAMTAALGVGRVEKEEDLLVFLPTRDADVQRFSSVSERFGALRVALVGVEVAPPHDVLEAETYSKIAHASDALRDLTGVDRVVSLSSITDVVAGPAGAEITPLVSGPPADEVAHAALRKKVLSRDLVVGNMISVDARAALIMVFLAQAKQGAVAPAEHVEDRIRAVAERELPGLTLTFGGAPFAGRAIYTEAQADVWRLSPIALAILLLVVLLAFRDPVGVALTVASVGYATLLVVGGMGFLGAHWTVATSTLPVILFASGSSYAVHVLGRYYLIRGADQVIDGPTALGEAMRIVGPPLAIAAATTSVGFFSFVATDVRPMRAFGIACGMGVVLCWLTSLTLVPAVMALFPQRVSRPLQLAWLGEGIARLWRWCERRRVWVLGLSALLAVVLVKPMLSVRVRMEPRSFFRKGSDPDRAERFLVDKFGGATFVQVAVTGDFDEPAALRALAQLEDYARTLPGVTQVQSIVAPLVLVSDAMGVGKRLPMTRGQASSLYFFLQGEPEIRSLLSADRKEVVVHARVADHAEAVVAALEQYVAGPLRAEHGWPTRDEVAIDVSELLSVQDKPELVAAITRSARVLAMPTDQDLELANRRERIALDLLRSADAPALRADAKAAAELAVERRSDGWRALWKSAAKTPADAELAADNLVTDYAALSRQLGIERAVPVLLEAAGRSDVPAAVRDRLARSVDDLFGPPEPVAAVHLDGVVAGEPVLDRGFSRAVERNQLVSLGISIVLVLAFLYALFRRASLALICMLPALATLVYQTGLMGVFGTHIDLGTSLVAGIATGAGSDFAMHYLWYLRSEDQERVSRTVGPVMVLSVALVAVGFFVLGLGRSPVMHLFGALAGGAMALSAFLSCVILPAALNGRRPS